MRGYAVTQPLASLKGKLPPQRLKGSKRSDLHKAVLERFSCAAHALAVV